MSYEDKHPNLLLYLYQHFINYILVRWLTRRDGGYESVIGVIPLVVLISEYHCHQTLFIDFRKFVDTFTVP